MHVLPSFPVQLLSAAHLLVLAFREVNFAHLHFSASLSPLPRRALSQSRLRPLLSWRLLSRASLQLRLRSTTTDRQAVATSAGAQPLLNLGHQIVAVLHVRDVVEQVVVGGHGAVKSRAAFLARTLATQTGGRPFGALWGGDRHLCIRPGLPLQVVADDLSEDRVQLFSALRRVFVLVHLEHALQHLFLLALELAAVFVVAAPRRVPLSLTLLLRGAGRLLEQAAARGGERVGHLHALGRGGAGRLQEHLAVLGLRVGEPAAGVSGLGAAPPLVELDRGGEQLAGVRWALLGHAVAVLRVRCFAVLQAVAVARQFAVADPLLHAALLARLLAARRDHAVCLHELVAHQVARVAAEVASSRAL